jgi:hypothetical protein
MARELGADETEKGREAFERAFKKVAPREVGGKKAASS